jgi:hypothetical protein
MPPWLRRDRFAKRFPPPWSIEDIGGCFVVMASNDRPLVFIYYGGRCRPPIPREVTEPEMSAYDPKRTLGAFALESAFSEFPATSALYASQQIAS